MTFPFISLLYCVIWRLHSSGQDGHASLNQCDNYELNGLSTDLRILPYCSQEHNDDSRQGHIYLFW